MKKTVIISVFIALFLMAHALQGQKFKFSIHASALLAQVDGDKLRGFNKLGYTAGIQGGYCISPSSELIVTQGFSSFGSTSTNKSISKPGDYFLEIDIVSANLLFAYAHYLNSGWSNTSSFRVLGGVKIHQVLSNEYSLNYNTFEENPPVRIEEFRERFLGLYLGAGYLITPNLYFDVAFEHALNNLLSDSNLNSESKSLNPYQLSFGLNFYL